MLTANSVCLRLAAAPAGQAEERNVPGAIEHLAGTMRVSVRRRGRTVWEGTSHLAALEHGSIDRARADGTSWDARPVWVVAAGAGLRVR